MKFDIITIFPELFQSFTRQALIARAQLRRSGRSPNPRQGGASGAKPIIEIHAHNLRDWTTDAHKTVDDRPYGGGAGMVLMVEPIQKAIQALQLYSPALPAGRSTALQLKRRIVVFSAKGKVFNQAMARRYAKLDQLIMICGRYEGIDERVAQYLADEEISIGEYVLFGGEVPAMVVMETVTRLIPGALGKPESLKEESFHSSFNIHHSSFREYPHYTRPEIIEINGKPRRVPKVLLSGNHAKIAAWREKHSRRASPKGREEWRKKKSKTK